jgi:hypothetical protein
MLSAQKAQIAANVKPLLEMPFLLEHHQLPSPTGREPSYHPPMFGSTSQNISASLGAERLPTDPAGPMGLFF